MDNSLERRYLELMRGFTAEEKDRLPLEYNIYSGDLPGLIESFAQSNLRLDIPELDTLDSLCRKLTKSMDYQLQLNLPWKPPMLLLPRDRKKIRAQRLIVRQVIASRSANLHRRILEEYFFLTNFVDLMMLVQKAAAERLGGEIEPAQLALYTGAAGRLVKLFQDTDNAYEQVQTALQDQHG